MVEPNQAKSIFLAASEKPPAERAAFLDEAAGGDSELRARVEALLKAHDDPDRFLDKAGAQFATFDHIPPAPLAEHVGTLIGPYKLLEQIGEGGMGVVYMAEQTAPVQRKVAVKIIKPGMDSRQVIARFEAERQALALMDHPNIAKMLDAATTDTGRPYFVMELVKGVSITSYCDQHTLSTKDRLHLFMTVCSAVQHAHQKGIIHRDLKPTNVLVADYDDRPVTKIIDFGVAKAVGQQLTDRTMFTEFGQVLGTIEYMSPEQAKLNQLDIDTRTDIYSLGVLLYELLVGSTPFDKERLRSAAFDEMLRIIREEEPLAPSTRLSTSQALPSIAANRQLEPKKLTTLVRGDLDWIVMKSLEKDRTRRYETATGLAEDIQRYLTDQPVEARRPTRGYRLKKFIRRNKAGVLAGSAIVAALLIGSTVASIGFLQARRQAIRADHEAQIARTQAARSEQVAQFLKDMLEAAGPGVARGRDATLLREILDKTAGRVDKDLQDQPEVQGDLWFILGDTYDDIGDGDRAIASFQHSVDIYRSVLGDENTKLALALGHLGRCQSLNGDVSSGKKNAQLGLEIARTSGDRETLATCLFDTARSFDLLVSPSSEGLPFVREALAIRKRLDTNPVALADCMYLLAASLVDTPEAESLARETLAMHRQYLGTDHPLVARDMKLLAHILMGVDKLSEAEAVLRQTLELSCKIYDPPQRVIVHRYLAETLIRQGKWSEANSVLQQAIEQDPSNPWCLNNLGSLNALRGEWPAAVQQFSKCVELDPKNAEWKSRLAISLLKSARPEEYRRLRHEYLEHDDATVDLESPVDIAITSMLLPLEPVDFEAACRLGDVAARPNVLKRQEYWCDVVKALTEYRRGQFQSARDLATLVVSRNDNWRPRLAQAWIILALANAQLHQAESARAALAKGQEFINRSDRDNREDLLWNWPAWSAAELLQREAAELLGVGEPKPAPVPQP